MNSDTRSRVGRGMPWLVVAGVLLAAMSLRGPIVAPTAVLRLIEQDFGIGAATAGLLTTAPVLMFAALTPLAALVIRRAGAELALMLSLSGVLVGTFVRALPGFGWMLAGMFIIGAFITVGNVVIPVVIRRDVPPDRVALVTAAYAATLNVGSLITSLGTAPLAEVIGWNAALLSWSVLTVAGIALWAVHIRRSRRAFRDGDGLSGEPTQTAALDTTQPTSPVLRAKVVRDSAGNELDSAAITGPLPVIGGSRDSRSLLKRPVAWFLVASFALQCTIYYGLTTWLPSFAADELNLDATSAGAVASIYQGVGIAGAFVVPLLSRFAPRWVAPFVICVSWLTVSIGLLAAPQLLWAWLAVGAVGHAGGFVVIFSALVAVSRSDGEAAGLSAMVQGFGYAIGALGGPVIGLLHERSGGWSAPLTLVLVLSSLYCVALVSAVVFARRATR
ncbi:CynX/NimT family MFS transporter [Microbacterium marmarense]|uniref:MFS transporter n=1 Tax=Microbacterium marmarense TaxID=3122051 RepID=A0ABU8LUJ6_9MICO